MPSLTLEPVPSNGATFSDPILVTSPPGDPRLFVVEQHSGQILVIKDDTVLATPFLAVGGLSNGNEQGLLGLAFHPNFATNGRFFINYTDNTGGDTHVTEYHAAPGADVADPNPVQDILVIGQPFSNHNGGNILFGPDGYLYIGMGDGGSGGDPQENGQNLNALLGKMLRIDVDGAAPYAIPANNPFAGGGGAPEIWAYGLRNPWRWSFDRLTGDLYIADVGQNEIEELDFQPASSTGGENYGWNEWEGNNCFDPPCNMAGKTFPVHTYTHADGCSVTGGFVYRGCRMPDLAETGTYFFTDYCSGEVQSFVVQGGAAANLQSHAALSGGNISSFGQDAQGELYVVRHNTGEIFRIAPQ